MLSTFFFLENENMQNKALKSILFLNVIGIIVCFFLSNYVVFDGFEHIKISYLVSQGNVPYRDFFEHHHPLLWYVFAPIMYVLPHNFALAYYTSRIFSLICSLATLFIIGKTINKFLGGKENVLYFLVILFMFFPMWFCISHLKPDILARLFYFAGLYYFFCYAEKFQTKDLVYCALCFIFSFFTLQNMVISIFPLAIPMLYLWRKQKKVGKDILISAIAPICLTAIVVAVFVAYGIWKPYFQLNWIYNAHLFEYTHINDISLLYCWKIPVLMGVCAWLWQIKQRKTTFYINTIGILCIAEIIQHMYFKAVFHHYLILLFIYVSILAAPVAINIKNKIVKAILFVATIVIFGLNFNYVWNYDTQMFKDLNELNPKEDEYIFNVGFRYVNVYAPLISYYQLYVGTAKIDNILFDRYPDYDINKFIEEHKVKYLDYVLINNKYINPSIPKEYNRFEISNETLSKYEEVRPALWQRKEEYR